MRVLTISIIQRDTHRKFGSGTQLSCAVHPGFGRTTEVQAHGNVGGYLNTANNIFHSMHQHPCRRQQISRTKAMHGGHGLREAHKHTHADSFVWRLFGMRRTTHLGKHLHDCARDFAIRSGRLSFACLHARSL